MLRVLLFELFIFLEPLAKFVETGDFLFALLHGGAFLVSEDIGDELETGNGEARTPDQAKSLLFHFFAADRVGNGFAIFNCDQVSGGERFLKSAVEEMSLSKALEVTGKLGTAHGNGKALAEADEHLVIGLAAKPGMDLGELGRGEFL